MAGDERKVQTGPSSSPVIPSTPSLAKLNLAEEQAARSMAICNLPFDDGIGLAMSADDMLLELHRAFNADGDCEHLIFMQARVLDALFSRLLDRALTSPYENGERDNYVDGDRLDLALRSQKQCRKTVETLAVLRIRQQREE